MTATSIFSSTAINDVPQLLRCDSRLPNNWIKVKTRGTKSNRTGIGARIYCTTEIAGKPHRQTDEVRSGGSYISRAICAFTLAWVRR